MKILKDWKDIPCEDRPYYNETCIIGTIPFCNPKHSCKECEEELKRRLMIDKPKKLRIGDKVRVINKENINYRHIGIIWKGALYWDWHLKFHNNLTGFYDECDLVKVKGGDKMSRVYIKGGQPKRLKKARELGADYVEDDEIIFKESNPLKGENPLGIRIDENNNIDIGIIVESCDNFDVELDGLTLKNVDWLTKTLNKIKNGLGKKKRKAKKKK